MRHFLFLGRIIILLTIFTESCISKPFREDINAHVNKDKMQEFFLPVEIIKMTSYGVKEEELYLHLGTDRVKFRKTFKVEFPKRLRENKYIPIHKSISYFGGKSSAFQGDGFTTYMGTENVGVTFYFYKERLIHYTLVHSGRGTKNQWIDLPDSSEEVLYANLKKTEIINFSGTNGHEESSFWEKTNGYDWKGKSNYKPDWQQPDFEKKLKEAGYYELKAKLDKDFVEKKGAIGQRRNR
jgi:hypothetical protein